MTTIQETRPAIDVHPAVSLSVVVPVYNQEKNVSTSLARIKEVLDSTLISYEIVVVNDGSLDDTSIVLQKEMEKDKRVKVISYFPNNGKGYAVKTGVMASKGKVVMFTDGDLDISPAVIKDYFRELEGCDLVIASKRHPRSKVRAPFSRKLLSRMFNLLVQILVGIKIKDTQSGLKAGRGDILRKIFAVILVKRYAFDVELLSVASMLGLNIKEMPVEINLNRRFKYRDIARMFIDVLAISYRHKIRQWYRRRLELELIKG